MNSSRPLADPVLTTLLTKLLAEEALPPLDRWFSEQARRQGWPQPEQKRLWDALRRALTRVFPLLDAGSPEATTWPGLRVRLRGRAAEWALRADLPSQEGAWAAAGIAGWLAPALKDRIHRSSWTDEQTSTFLASQERAAPVHVRFQASPDGDACAQSLIEQGAVEASDVEGIYRLATDRGLEGGDAWNRGLVEIQDAASQLSLARLELRPGMRVWDACAGRGGKTLLAARELRGKGVLVATDIAEGKLKGLKERVRRSGWQNIRVAAWDGFQTPDFGPEVKARGGFDRVIVDAPCSASGTWRRDPEGRFRLMPKMLQELNRHQHRLIRLGWDALRSGGKLAYVTCSWLVAEDEGIVEDFLEESGGRLVHQELLGLPYFDANTMFVAVVEKP